MSKELEKSAILHFESNPKVDIFHVTTDGQCFENEHVAAQHGKTLGTNELREVVTFKRADVLTEESNEGEGKGKNANDAIKDIKEAETLEKVKELLVGEDRSSVIKAGEKRIAELSK